jgi:hypothetical protein
MRRSLVYGRWKAKEWMELANKPRKAETRIEGQQTDVSLTDGLNQALHKWDIELIEGQRAYAFKQVSAYDGLVTKWAAKWQPLVTIAKSTIFRDEIVSLDIDVCTTREPVVIDVGEEDDNDAPHGDLVSALSIAFY